MALIVNTGDVVTGRGPSWFASALRHAGPLKSLRGFNRIADALVPLRKEKDRAFDVDFHGYRYRGSFSIDVQGAEQEAFEGLRQILSHSRPLVWTEVSPATVQDFPTLADLSDATTIGPAKVIALVPNGSKFNTGLRLITITEADYRGYDGNLLIIPANI